MENQDRDVCANPVEEVFVRMGFFLEHRVIVTETDNPAELINNCLVLLLPFVQNVDHVFKILNLSIWLWGQVGQSDGQASSTEMTVRIEETWQHRFAT